MRRTLSLVLYFRRSREDSVYKERSKTLGVKKDRVISDEFFGYQL